MNSIVSKLAKASIELGSLAADKKNDRQGYSYISADKILDKVGDVMARNGIVIIPTIVGSQVGVITPEGGKPYNLATVIFKMIISDGENEIIADWCGYGNDYAAQDKAIVKAITTGHKYFLMKLFNVGVGNEDGEHEDEKGDKKNFKQSPAQSQQQKEADKPQGMTIEEAMDIVGSDGVRYGDRKTEELTYVYNNAKTPPEKKIAAKMILDWRAAKEAQKDKDFPKGAR